MRTYQELARLERHIYLSALETFNPQEIGQPVDVAGFQDVFRGIARIPLSGDGERLSIHHSEASAESVFSPWSSICSWLSCSYWRADTDKRETVASLNPEVIAEYKREQTDKNLIVARTFRVWAVFYFLSTRVYRKSKNLLTLNRFLAMQARYKLPIEMIFGETLAKECSDHGPVSFSVSNEYIEAVGTPLKAAIDKYLQSPASPQQEDLLRSAVLGSREIDNYGELISEASSIWDSYLKGIDIARKSFRRELTRWCRQVQEGCGVELEDEGVYALVTPVLLYYWYLASPYVYSLPVPLGWNRAAVMSLAFTERLGDTELVHLESIVKSVFTQALNRDFVYRVAREQLNTSLYNFTRMVGHNFPKLFTTPFGTQLRKIERSILSSPSIHRELAPRIEAMGVVIDHYERLFGTLLGGVGLKRIFSQLRVEVFSFEEIQEKVIVIFKLLRESRLERDVVNSRPLPILERNVKLEFDGDCELCLRTSRSFLLETILNLLQNALGYIRASDLEEDPLRGLITIRVARHASLPLLRVEVIDRGAGFAPGQLVKTARILAMIRDAREEDLWQLADSEVANAKAREERLGIGLILSAVFLRSLQWNSGIGMGGWIEVGSRLNEGTTTSLLVPRLA